MNVIEQARAWLADYMRRPVGRTINKYGAGGDDIAALCRALIQRTEALRELVAAEDALDNDPSGGACDRYKSAYRAARRSLADD
jgi:hypothetical protein